MQYLLSKEELDNLVPKQEKKERDEALVLARKRILEVAEYKCIHDGRRGYCDDCPCLMNDKEAKEYEFKVGSRHTLNARYYLICNLSKSFSK